MNEHEESMKRAFPDYPCADCGRAGKSCIGLETVCQKWREWFAVTWVKLRKELKETK